MRHLTYLKDTPFLKELIKQKLKTIYAKIIVLDKNELPVESIEGKVTAGSININGSSAVRRTGSITFVAEESDNIQLTDVNHLLSMNRRIRIFIGMDNAINDYYDKRIWFPLGIYVITQPNISHSSNGVTIQLSFKDKMCLLNGECGGGLPASIILDEYDQVIGCETVEALPMDGRNDYTIYILEDPSSAGSTTYWMWDTEQGWVEGSADWLDEKLGILGKTESRKQRVFDIIQTLVANYGGEDLAKILINDVPLEIKQIVRFTGEGNLYYNTASHYFSLNEQDKNIAMADQDLIKVFSYNEDVGYMYTDFTYPGELVSGIGDNVAAVLEKIKNTLGNYEYFYDIDGNFVFQEIKNYLNTSYSTAIVKDNSLLNNGNYKADFNNSPQSVFTFEEGSELIISYSNTPAYSNIKNDFHIWGETNSSKVIHYHLAIKTPPELENEYYVVYEVKDGEYTGKIRLALEEDFALQRNITESGVWTPGDGEISIYDIPPTGDEEYAMKVEDDFNLNLETLYLTDGLIQLYKPTDWRVELYMQGLQKKALGQRPDIYEQELLDYMDIIYDFQKQEYKVDILNKPNELTYYIDFLEPTENLHDCSVDVLGPRIHSYQQDKINKLYSADIPDVILINVGYNQVTKDYIKNRCEDEGQPYSNVSQNVFNSLSLQTTGYAAQETMRELLYQYTNYNEQVSISSVPIYFLDANTRISIYDKASNIYGDYIIKSISLPLTANGNMSISAARAQERI